MEAEEMSSLKQAQEELEKDDKVGCFH